MYSRRRSGFSLIEILLVIGVIAILALAAFLVYPKVRLNYQINDQKQRLEMIAMWASSTYGTRLPANFAGGGSSSPLALSGVAKMNVNNTGFVDVWDGRMDVLNMSGELSPSYSRCVSAANIVFYLNGVPVEACQQLVSQLLRSPDRTCYINVGGRTIWAPPGAPTLPTPDAIVQACTSNAVSDTVAIRVGISP